MTLHWSSVEESQCNSILCSNPSESGGIEMGAVILSRILISFSKSINCNMNLDDATYYERNLFGLNLWGTKFDNLKYICWELYK